MLLQPVTADIADIVDAEIQSELLVAEVEAVVQQVGDPGVAVGQAELLEEEDFEAEVVLLVGLAEKSTAGYYVVE